MLDAERKSHPPKLEPGTPPVLVLRDTDIASLVDAATCLAAVEAAFASHASGTSTVPMPMHIPADGGGFHVKGAAIDLDRRYVVVKVNGNFAGNPARNGRPVIQGALLLCDGSNGSLLAIMDSAEITLRRTAAASALAARHLARPDSRSIAICGCGVQGRAHLVALAQVTRLERVRVWDIDPDRAAAFASDMRQATGLDIRVAADVRDATRPSAIVVTTTSSQVAYLTGDCISPGTFIAAVGADSPHKSEIDARLLADSKIVVDSLAQCLAMGDLHHAVDAGQVGRDDVHAELGDLVAGRKPGRTNAEEITVFDSTGLAIEDAGAATCAYRRALSAGVGLPIRLSSF
jgi:ornithine cyclodeaminase/alanine dehydrogenase-like protein (mu-crystallin family)